MTQSTWKISEAKARLSEVVQASGEGPQLLCSRGKPVAAIIGMDQFHDYQRFQSAAQRPTMGALLAELDGINQIEADFGDPPPRVNRPQPECD
jgi:prevent-host-death family protein